MECEKLPKWVGLGRGQKIVAWPELDAGSPTDFKGDLILRTRLVMLKTFQGLSFVMFDVG